MWWCMPGKLDDAKYIKQYEPASWSDLAATLLQSDARQIKKDEIYAT